MGAAPIATLLFAPVSGALSDRFGTRAFAVSGMCVAAFGLYLMSNLEASSSAFDVFWRLAVTGVGMGLFQSPNNSAIMGCVPPWHLGIASGTIAAMRNVGMVTGIAVAGAVLYAVAPFAASQDPSSFTPANIEMFLEGLRWAFLTGAGLAALGALTSLMAVGRRKDVVVRGNQRPS
jgi:MFS family permease